MARKGENRVRRIWLGTLVPCIAYVRLAVIPHAQRPASVMCVMACRKAAPLHAMAGRPGWRQAICGQLEPIPSASSAASTCSSRSASYVYVYARRSCRPLLNICPDSVSSEGARSSDQSLPKLKPIVSDDLRAVSVLAHRKRMPVLA